MDVPRLGLQNWKGLPEQYNATPERITSFVQKFSRPIDDKALKEKSDRLSYFSTPRPGERTTFLADMIELTDLGYLGYDVCPSPGTEIFDLNIQRLPAERRKGRIYTCCGCSRLRAASAEVSGSAFHQA